MKKVLIILVLAFSLFADADIKELKVDGFDLVSSVIYDYTYKTLTVKLKDGSSTTFNDVYRSVFKQFKRGNADEIYKHLYYTKTGNRYGVGDNK